MSSTYSIPSSRHARFFCARRKRASVPSLTVCSAANSGASRGEQLHVPLGVRATRRRAPLLRMYVMYMTYADAPLPLNGSAALHARRLGVRACVRRAGARSALADVDS